MKCFKNAKLSLFFLKMPEIVSKKKKWSGFLVFTQAAQVLVCSLFPIKPDCVPLPHFAATAQAGPLTLEFSSRRGDVSDPG